MAADTSVGLFCYSFDLAPANYLVVEAEKLIRNRRDRRSEEEAPPPHRVVAPERARDAAQVRTLDLRAAAQTGQAPAPIDPQALTVR